MKESIIFYDQTLEPQELRVGGGQGTFPQKKKKHPPPTPPRSQ